ncbi:hypothetical protein QTG54_008428 [Skeletonema marinoi]|uniref:Uncharacterized protein n=1 Tax=Skeletonema marinoi TaxID=267567 RepID=A0AAD9DB95_9STRA|nr:hypothetical protein QTG54_008428 [Skeletonema marinoi]
MAQNHPRSFGTRIIGGKEATPGRYKHYVSLFHSFYGHFCGGTLIAPIQCYLLLTVAVAPTKLLLILMT